MDQPRRSGVVVPGVFVRDGVIHLRVLLDPVQIGPRQHFEDPLEEVLTGVGDQNGVGEDEAVEEEGVLVPLRVRLLRPVDWRIEIAKLAADPELSLRRRVDLASWRLGAVHADEGPVPQPAGALLQRGEDLVGPFLRLSIAL